MMEEIDDLKTHLDKYLKDNPFCYKYVWAGAISKKHQKQIEVDNNWYHQVMGLAEKKEMVVYEPAPF